jgi:hypothetical protein
MPEYTIAMADDWGGVYVDGHLVYQGHAAEEFVAAQIAEILWAQYYVDEHREFPAKLSEVAFDADRDDQYGPAEED